MQGDLCQINVADLAAHIYLARLTGVLRLSQTTVKKNIYYIGGRIVFGHSNLQNEKLGQILIRLGKINNRVFYEVSRELGPGRRLGKLLQEAGHLSELDIGSAVNYQLQKIVYSVFNWDSGIFEFEERSRPVHEDIIVEVSTPELIIGGIRNIANHGVLERAIPLDAGMVERYDGAPDIEWNDWNLAEETVLSLADGTLNVSALHQRTGLIAAEFNRALYALSLSGKLKIRNAEASGIVQHGEKYLKTRRREDAENRVVPQNVLGKYSEAEIRELVELTAMKFLEVSDEEVLNLPPKASSELIQRHYDYLTGVFHPCYYSTDRYHDLKHTLKYIVDRLSEAHQSLMEKASGEAGERTVEDYSGEPVMFPLQEWWKNKPSMKQKPSMQDVDPSPPPQTFYLSTDPIIADIEMLENSAALPPSHQNGFQQTIMTLRAEAVALRKAGKFRDAEAQLLKALQLGKRDLETHFALSDFYQSQGLKFKAFKHLNIILQLDPNNKKALDLLGVQRRKRPLFEIPRNKD
jgi:tetratricopeptide (TPR) repeat protein